MAKTYNNLYPDIYSFESLHAAYMLARRGKRDRREVQKFEQDLEGNLIQLQNELIWGMYQTGHYRQFIVNEPKERLVAALPFRHLFRDVFVVEDKNAGVYAAALAKTGLKGEDAVMIGDSLKSDIIPARKNGMEAIHVAALNWHGREMAGQTLPEGAHAAPSITAAVDDVVARFARTPANDAKPAAPQRKSGGPRP